MLEFQSVMSLVVVLAGATPVTPPKPAAPPVVAQAAPTPPKKTEAPKQAPTPAAPKPAGPATSGAKAESGAKAPAMEPEVAKLVERMQRFYEATEDFRAEFTQAYTYKTFKRTQTSSGKVTFKKPGLMRWDYEKPSPRSFVLAGSKVYAYDPEGKTLTVAALDTSQLSASVTFLFGQGRLQDEFAITQGACKDCKGTLLVLDPLKPDPRFRQVRLEVDPKTAQVLRSIVIDPDGSENAITFIGLKTNQGVEREFFTLKPPADTQVVDYTRPKAP